jgi:hypothetical protein
MEVDAEANDDASHFGDEDADSSEDELPKRFDKMVFVAATRKLEQWVRVIDVCKTDSDSGVAEIRSGEWLVLT